MKDTKTSRPASECQTLLHYLACMLMKTDAEFVNFMDDLPHLEAAARGTPSCCRPKTICSHISIFSVHANSFFFGLNINHGSGASTVGNKACSCNE